MHSVGHIEIRNFRLCRNVSLPLEGFTPLVGQNNAGKSTILDAIGLILKPTAPSANDFADSSQPIEICARIDGITSALLGKLPEQKHRKAIEPFCANGFLWIRVITKDRKFKPEVYDHESYSGIGTPLTWRDYPTGLPQAVSALLPDPLQIEAMEDINEDLGKIKAGTTIKALLDEIMEPILQAHGDLSSALNTVRQVLTSDGTNRSNHLKEFDEKASKALENFFPGLSLDLDIQVIEAKEFFKAGDLHVTDKITGDRHRFDQMGTGTQRAIQMALIRYLADARSNTPEKSSRRLLLIDEPELYLHPQGVRRLRQALEELSNVGFQVVFSTHSPLMLSRENAANTVIVAKNNNQGTTTHKPLRVAVSSALSDAESQSRTLFELGNVAEIYFSERVVLCEGKTDRRLLPLAYERLYGHPPELDHVTFVSLGACSDIPKALPVLSAMGIKACAIADLDFAFTEARKGSNPILPKDGEDLKKVKTLLHKLQQTEHFPLGDNGLPTKNKGTGWQASDTWALMARDNEGKMIAESVHSSLKSKGIWVWPVGCIEQVTMHTDKGEEAIIEQESKLNELDANQLEQDMPIFKICFEWIKSL